MGFFIICLTAVWLLQLLSDLTDEDAGVLLSRCGAAKLVPSGDEIGYALFGGDTPRSLAELEAIRNARKETTGGLTPRLQLVNARLLKSIDALESCLDENAFYTNRIVPTVRGIATRALGAGGENALVGKAGWLFYKPGVDHLLGPSFWSPDTLSRRRAAGNEWTERVEPDPAAAILELHQQLASRGIALIVMPTSLKPMIYPDHYSLRFDGTAAPLRNPSFDAFKAHLETSGVKVFDPSDALMAARLEKKAPVFLRTDTHWSPRGVRTAAAALTAFIDEAEVPLEGRDTVRYRRRPTDVSNRGDIGVMLNVSPAMADPPEKAAIDQVFTDTGAPWKKEKTARVLLLGDSFTNIYSLDGMGWGTHAGFGAQLSAELGMPVDVISQNDSGAYATRQQLSRELAAGRDRLAGKQLVIYQFAARELSFGNWKTGMPMRVGSAADPGSKSDSPITVNGTVSAVLKSPAPGSVAYKDCYIPLHLTDIDAPEGTLDTDEMVVFVWGMLDGALTDYNRLVAGDRVALSVVPFAAVSDEVSAYRHEEFTDPERLALDTYFGDARRPGKTSAQTAHHTPQPPTEIDSASTASARTLGDEPDGVRQMLDAIEKTYRSAAEQGSPVVAGRDGWLYLPSELRHLAAGRFWGDAANRVGRATQADNRDPLPAILDFYAQLKSAGIDLLVVPVPAKAAVYPEALVDNPKAAPSRPDIYLQQFLSLLESEGVPVLDLTDAFRQARDKGDVYCRQDSHWSGLGIKTAARGIFERIESSPWLASVERQKFGIRKEELTLTGDLWTKLGRPDLQKEVISLGVVSGDDGETISPWRESPVVLLGDSHTLVFHAGDDMHAKGAGLADHLARALGFPVDLVGVRGSGATPSRVALMRRGDNLEGKKLVIWVFAARELTESQTGWARVPVIR